MLVLLGVLTCIPQALAVWCFARGMGGPRLRGRWVRTLGLLSLCALPAVLGQVAYALGGFSATTVEPGAVLAMLPWSWTVLLGGFSVQGLFEATAAALSGHRQATMLDNWPYYVALTWLELALAALFVALRRDESKGLRDRTLLTVGLLVLLDALAGIPWPWWGS